MTVKLALARAEAFAARHPRGLTSGVVGLLSGFAITAFGIAPLAPDARNLPQQIVTESIQSADLESQLAEIAAQEVGLSRNDFTRSSDTIEALFKRLGAFDPAAAQFLRKDPLARRILQGRAGKMVQLTADASGNVQSLVVRFQADKAEQLNTHFSRLSIERQART